MEIELQLIVNDDRAVDREISRVDSGTVESCEVQKYSSWHQNKLT